MYAHKVFLKIHYNAGAVLTMPRYVLMKPKSAAGQAGEAPIIMYFYIFPMYNHRLGGKY